MALRETHVDIDFTANADPLRQVNNEINNVLKNTTKMGAAYGAIDDASKRMLKDMKDGFREQRDSMMKWRNDMIGAEYGFYMLSKRAKDYHWGTNRLMESINGLGATHKKATDAMIADDDRLKMSIYKTVGIMNNMSTQAQKTKDALNLWKNPIYIASLGSLTMLDRMQKLSFTASAASVALERLGKNANAKELADEIQRLNRGLGALPIAYLIAGGAAFFFYGAIHKAAMKNEEYADSWNKMKETLRKAIQPMIDVFIMIMVPVYKFLTMIGELIIKFNEAHPIISKIIGAFFLLLPALTLLLLPMGLGVGLVKGYAMAFGALMRMIGPVITLFATLSPVVWVVAGVIIGLVVAFTYLYNNFAWFREAVHGIFSWLKTQIMAMVSAVMEYVNQIIAKIKAFWTENKDMIMTAVQNIIAIGKMLWDGLLPMFQLLFELIKTTVKNGWAFIKLIFNTAIDVILALVKTFGQIMTGDWRGALDTLLQISQTILNNIWDFFKEIFGNILDFLKGIDLYDVGADIINGLLDGLKAAGSAALEYVQELGKSIKKIMSKVLDINSPSYEMFKLGRWTVQGQIEGMDSQRKHLMAISHEMAAMPMEYTPESTGTTTNNNSNRSVTFAPVLNITSNGGDTNNIKRQALEALDEAWAKLGGIYDVEVIR